MLGKNMKYVLWVLFVSFYLFGTADNPLIKGIGMSDPHIRVFNDTIYLFTGHDSHPDDKTWVMRDWRVFSSTDLINWKLATTISPKYNYMPDSTTDCWAGDAATRNGKYYFYFSDQKRSVGVMQAEHPGGKYTDALGKPLVAPMHDPTILVDDDKNKTPYLVYGDKEGGGYHIARLNNDMISLSEKPRPIVIEGEAWKNAPTWMDKNYLFKHQDTYYLSWGRDYAISKNICGPYICAGSVGKGHNLNEFAHGSFFNWKGQFYHIWTYYIRPGYKYRECIISYCHMTNDGKIVTDTGFLDKHFETGVGQYDASWDKIEAEWFTAASEISKKDNTNGGFAVGDIENNDYLIFPNIKGLSGKSAIEFKAIANSSVTIEIRNNSPEGELLATINMKPSKSATGFENIRCNLPKMADNQNLCFVFKGKGKNLIQFDSFQFFPETGTKLTLTDFSEMQAQKKRIVAKEKESLESYTSLIKNADKALLAGPFSVMNKTGIPPSGNKHDYMTLAPYFWPNPDTPNRLPYIRKDGEVNPETRDNFTDFKEKENFFNAIDVLGKAFYYSENKAYGEKAISLIRTWFLDEATKMNPHLNYGQGVRGESDGRPLGIIEFGGIRELIECMEILEHGRILDETTKKGIKNWFSEYKNWLQNSKIGTEERNTLNNHGTWYDVQICSILLYLGELEQLKTVLEQAKTKRIASQIEPDGSQPQELARTKSFSYSTMNLSAFTKLAWFGQKVGIDLWNFETADGRSIKKAYEYLIPYISTDKKWEYKQLGNLEEVKAGFVNLLMEAGKTFNEENYVSIAQRHQLSKSGQTQESH